MKYKAIIIYFIKVFAASTCLVLIIEMFQAKTIAIDLHYFIMKFNHGKIAAYFVLYVLYTLIMLKLTKKFFNYFVFKFTLLTALGAALIDVIFSKGYDFLAFIDTSFLFALIVCILLFRIPLIVEEVAKEDKYGVEDILDA